MWLAVPSVFFRCTHSCWLLVVVFATLQFRYLDTDQGVLALTMVSMSGALMAKKEVLEPFLALILRDDLLSWHVSKAPVNRTEEQQKAVRLVS